MNTKKRLTLCCTILLAILSLGCKRTEISKPADKHINSENYKLYKLYAGYSNSFILKPDGTLWAAGENTVWMFGTDNEGGVYTSPVKILDDVSEISVGAGYLLAVKKDKTLWISGWDALSMQTYKQFTKIADNIISSKAFHAPATPIGIALKSDNTLWVIHTTTSSAGYQLQKIKDNVIKIEAGEQHALILTKDNTVWGYGNNLAGQLGVGDNNADVPNGYANSPVKIMEHVRDMAAGFLHTLILQEDHSIWAMGSNGNGQLGDGTTVDRTVPVKIMNEAISISCGYYHSHVIKKDFSLWAMGNNYRGQLGDGTTIDRSTPKRITDNVIKVSDGSLHTIILKSDSSFWVTGSNEYGQLGIGESGLGAGNTNFSSTFIKMNITK
ncbi:RCC1 domain-containing protein [Niabella drilacis]|uniref:Alpha-tubulin suppressor n=1 Tax=Niabella drilacis (strain DSM 25811 / CCM 8410 / CCUG 62505 / LMG 26954 / E90) TaxID=1285928 RepID=A0A1G7C6T9_NIADE|nr:hypothetical protein [Niabella drilacis]SDE34923.1 Alpha-tubulin suppressor [Niabella drilacis]